MAWRLATWPTRRSPSLVYATTDGVRRWPSSLTITFGSRPSMMATTLLVVPRSIPMILDIEVHLLGGERGKSPSGMFVLVGNLRAHFPGSSGARCITHFAQPPLWLCNGAVTRRVNPLLPLGMTRHGIVAGFML